MKTPDYFVWPTAKQDLLLTAALAPRERARAAYAKWCETTDINAPVDPGSLGLFPLIHDNIAPIPQNFDHIGRLQGMRKRSFVEAQRAIGAAGEASHALSQAGIKALVMKGVPIALDYYDDPGLRPMDDADLQVRPSDAKRAIDALLKDGWEIATEGWDAARSSNFVIMHAVTLKRIGRPAIDLHWRMLIELVSPEIEARLWGQAGDIALPKGNALRPDPTVLLMHVLLHGLRRNPKSPLRWIPDALHILAKDGDAIDWDWLISASRHARTFHRIALALAYLEQNFSASLPRKVHHAVASSKPSFIERLENRDFLSPVPSWRALNSLRIAKFLRLKDTRSRLLSLGWLLQKKAGHWTTK